MDNELIVVRQLPVIEDQLRTVHDNIQARVTAVLDMECTEETYKEVKKARSELNAQYRMLEERRKEVKAQIEAPYKQFEKVYKACAGDLFTQADKQLAEKIASVEAGLKQKKSDAVRVYFEEYRDSLGIPADLVSYDRAGIVVTLSASAKSLKTQAQYFLDLIGCDLEFIATQEHKDEILVEYRKTLKLSRAVTTVTNRHAEIERQRRMREEMETTANQQREAEKAVQRAVEATVPQPVKEEPVAAVLPPVVVERTEDAEPPKQYSTAFEVTGSIDQLKALKKLLVDGGYVYQQLTKKILADGGYVYE